MRFSAATHFGRRLARLPVRRLGEQRLEHGIGGDARVGCGPSASAETCPALSVHSATWSVIQRIWVHAASRLAASAAFGLGNVYWCGMDHTTGCLKSRGTGATVNSTLASRSPVKFHEPAIHMPSLPAMKASRQLALAGGAILSGPQRLPQNSATSIAAGSASADRLRSDV